MVWLLRHRQTKGAATDRLYLRPPRHMLTLPKMDLRSVLVVLEKVAGRINDDKVMQLLKLILKASGNRNVPQGGVISPLLSNVYLNEVDKMLERAKRITRYRQLTLVEYDRFPDDMAVLVNAHPKQR
jgi:RNA-directed DNA polymerase